MALLHLMHDLAKRHDTRLFAVTVNHNLREGAEAEARAVGDYCAALGVPHDILIWDDWDGKGNLQASARDARYRRMAEWAEHLGVGTIAVGHTADDQAETVLMRLGRRAGVDGLAAIPPRTVRHGIVWVRPLLSVTRADLRWYLRQNGIGWSEDPSNDDNRFVRIKARQALAALGDLGIDASGLAVVAAQMRDARSALDWQTFLAARELAHVNAGAVVLQERRLRIQPEEIQRRLLVRALGWVSGNDYPPRRTAVATLMAALRAGQAATVDGCHALRVDEDIWVFREHEAVRHLRSCPGVPWDGRWRVMPIQGHERPAKDLHIAALGHEGIAQCAEWRAAGLPFPVALSTPAVWRDDTLVAAPLVGAAQNWHAALQAGEETFFAGLLSH
ncbi:tRNA(Ile)-lysidine synthase [Sulfitobacter sp. THAF37]|nr:tRNA(Ile)-lysidine synthase [Sulfitobacter sp. THAF37]